MILKSLAKLTISLAKSVFYENISQKEYLPSETFYNIHQNESCFVLGNGPSLAKLDNRILTNRLTFGTNGIFLKYCPTYYVTISREFYQNHIESIKELKVSKKFISRDLTRLFTGGENEIPLNCIWNVYGNFFGFRFPVPLKFGKHPNKAIYLGGSVLFVCLQLAYWMGFQRVILLGVDHKFGFSRDNAQYGGKKIIVEGNDNVHFDKNYNPSGHSTHCDMIATERGFSLALEHFTKNGREIVNATPDTELDIIPKVNLSDFV